MMHALQVIELHDDVQHELNSIREKQTNLQHSLQQLHENPDKALAAINHFNSTSTLSTSNQQSFLGHIANTLKTQSAIELNGVSWRYTEELYWSADEPQGLVELTELHDLDVNPFADETSIKDRLVLLSGLVDVTMNQQQASQVLMDFVNALADIDSVLDVVPVSSTFSSAPAMTLPSDARASTDSASAFVVALRILV